MKNFLQLNLKRLKLTLPSDFALFQDTIKQSAAQWQTVAKKIYGGAVQVSCDFSGESRPRTAPDAQTTQTSTSTSIEPTQSSGSMVHGAQSGPNAAANVGMRTPRSAQRSVPRQGKRVDVSDAQRWPNANLVLQHFPGVVTEMEVAANGTT